MRCFVIMPFDSSFDDVYAAIKQSVTSVDHAEKIDCMRLDETRPAGRITDRLLDALRAASFCVADLTGTKPNVMWETGYAMALGKPLIVVTQDVSTLPFDVRDMQALPYDRSQLYKSLGMPLRDIIRDTLLSGAGGYRERDPNVEDQARLVIGLGVQLAELKEMVGQIVAAWPDRSPSWASEARLTERLRHLEGSWLNEDSNSAVYIKVVGEMLVAPYCYGGNYELTAYYYDWREIGEYIFARFKWLTREIAGFTFLKPSGADNLQGAWWYDQDVGHLPDRPPKGSGNAVTWYRTGAKPPRWATEFFAEVERGGMDDYSA